ncbi:hypothetical protein [Nocardioides iriomotensis]|uniref:Uncharacterized protein n=1 Tax=Nocardioides iriomotensis TaxID=715784 RepID=A0A4Q5JAP7_9ACTN|nr:hypothetical protein [Nocardioides iriomotensis]RYU14845.1 hypothetical protein ETU37_02340 [Nocardioides iriomotensis]
MRFFVPGAADIEQAEHLWNATRTFAQDQLAWQVTDRRIFQLNYHHEGKPFVAEVGKPDPRTGETVLVILESNAFLVCTRNRGVVRGEPILVGDEEVRTITEFSR